MKIWNDSASDVSKLVELDTEVGRVGTKVASKVIMAEDLEKRHQQFAALVSSLFIEGQPVSWSSKEVISAKDRIQVLVDSSNLRDLRPGSDYTDQYKALQIFVEARQLYDGMGEGSIDEGDAKKIHSAFSTASENDVLFGYISQLVGQKQAAAYLDIVQSCMASEQMRRCLTVCAQSAQPFIEESKTVVSEIFNGTTDVDFENDTFTTSISKFELKSDSISAISTLSCTHVMFIFV